jgi:hypothetical protein
MHAGWSDVIFNVMAAVFCYCDKSTRAGLTSQLAPLAKPVTSNAVAASTEGLNMVFKKCINAPDRGWKVRSFMVFATFRN